MIFVGDLVRMANALADEQEPASMVVDFLNDAISRVNIEMKTTFPLMTLEDTESRAHIPEKWQRTLLVPFAVGRIKQRDSSQFEYSDAYTQFLEALADFKSKYIVPVEYKELMPGQVIQLSEVDHDEYISESGDSLYTVAEQYELDVKDLLELNDPEFLEFDFGTFVKSDIYDQPALPWLGGSW